MTMTNPLLDRTPLYVRAAAELRKRIATGQYTHALPNEYKLGEELGVSNGTMRLALKVLVNEGLIERVQGKGTTIRKVAPWSEMQRSIPDLLNLLHCAHNADWKPVAGRLVSVSKDGLATGVDYTAEELEHISIQARLAAAWLRQQGKA